MNTLLATLLIMFPFEQTVKSSTISAGGTTVKSNGSYISQVIGQQSVVTGSSVRSGLKVRQGFKQPSFLQKAIKSSGLVINLEEENPIEYTVFPNPFKTKLTIKLSDATSTETYLVIYDKSGNVMFEERYQVGITEIVLNKIENLRTGSYVLYIVNKGKPFVANVIKDAQ